MDEPSGAQLPSALLIDLALQPLAGRGIYHYIRQKGDAKTGVILLKLNGLVGYSRLLIQQRDEAGDLIWMQALKSRDVPDADAEGYIRRAALRDQDLWVIEIEDTAMENPFDGRTV
jgi:hypothetical protein